MSEVHEGGCQCGAVRFRTQGQPAKTAVCHCRYCQTRTGSAFGVSVYFPAAAVEHLAGALKDYAFTTESGRNFTSRFCPDCGTTVFWTIGAMPELTGVAGGTYDPPTFWYEVKREVFTRSRAPFVQTEIADSSETSSSYAPQGHEADHLRGA
jgi:hypothetical protein